MATPTAAYSIRLRVRLDNRPGTLGRLATAIGEAGGNITAIGGFDVRGAHLDEDVLVNCSSEEHIERVTAAVRGVDGVEVLEVADRTFEMHEGGKIEVLARMPIADRDDLSMAYTPGRGPGVHRHRAAARRWPTSSPSRRTRSPSSPTAPRCSASATSARPAPCR